MKKKVKRRIKYFTKRIYFWQRTLGFTDVDIHVGQQQKMDARASWYSELTARQISIYYSEHWINAPDTNRDELDKVAFHEVFESQLYVLRVMATDSTAEQVVDAEVHLLVQRAQNHIFPILRGLKK